MITPNQTYNFKIEAGQKILNYEAKVLAISEGFVTFEDKFGKTYNYNISKIISYELIKLQKNENGGA